MRRRTLSRPSTGRHYLVPSYISYGGSLSFVRTGRVYTFVRLPSPSGAVDNAYVLPCRCCRRCYRYFPRWSVCPLPRRFHRSCLLVPPCRPCSIARLPSSIPFLSTGNLYRYGKCYCNIAIPVNLLRLNVPKIDKYRTRSMRSFVG